MRVKEAFVESRRKELAEEARRLKGLWKRLYQVYLAILNQGMKLDMIVQPLK